MQFVRMHGTGNVFLALDGFREGIPEAESLPALARDVCTRRSDAKADGLLVLEPADGFAGRMTVYNADGSIAEMCGNGLRCIGKLLFDREYAGREFTVLTDAGPRQVAVLGSDGESSHVQISLGQPIFEPSRIPTTLEGTPPIEIPVSVSSDGAEQTVTVTCLSMGNPHAVVFVGDLDTTKVESLGPQLERHPAFPNRTNVEFVSISTPSELRLRVWERAVGETAACGTGAAAAAVAGVLTERTRRRVLVRLPGGELNVAWLDDSADVALQGEAVTLGVETR